MKKLLGIVLMMICFSNIVYSQKYESDRQDYMGDRFKDHKANNSHKIIFVKNDSLIADIYGSEVLKTKITFKENKDYHGKPGRIYNIQGGGIISIFTDEIFLNLASKDCAINYYLINYKEPTPEQQVAIDKENEQSAYELNVRLHGKMSADCVRNKTIKVGLSYTCIRDILGEPISEIITHTGTTITSRMDYSDFIIYTDMLKVTTFQQIFK